MCIHNSARSQIAEALLNHLYGRSFHAESAGLSPGELNPLAVQAMKDIGIDISHKEPRNVFDLLKSGAVYDYTITVCDEANGDRCPIFPGVQGVLHWGFPDPAAFTGAPHERLHNVRRVREAIRIRLTDWVRSLENGGGSG